VKATLAKALALLAAGAMPLACDAHGLEASGLASGLLHPIGGADHLLAMLGVGIVSAKLGGRWLWWLPATFMSGMTLGFVLGLSGAVASPVTEWGILSSVLVLGVLIAHPSRRSLWACLAALLFGACHGHAHGAELPAQASAWAFSAGFLIASAGFHAMGAIVGTLCRLQERQARNFGAIGAAMAAGAFALAVKASV
jgi:urease accessory protein